MGRERTVTADSEPPLPPLSTVPSRAREPYSQAQKQQLVAAVTLEQRVDLITAWMARGWYQPGDGPGLARAWNISESMVSRYASEARRMLSRELLSKSRDELLAELLARISYLGQDSLTRTEEVVTVKGEVVEVRRPDHRTALRAAEATGELLGLKIQRHHHTVQASELTTEQIIEQLQKQGVEVRLPALETTAEEVAETEEKQRNTTEFTDSEEP